MSPVSSCANPVGVLAFTLVTAFSHGASGQDWQNLPQRTQIATAEGQEITIVVRPEVRFSDSQSGGINMELRARARLDDLQAKGPDILRALASNKSSCETRWSFPQLSPATVQGGKLRVGGQVGAEQWLCVGPLQTRLVGATADFIIALQPVRRESEVAVAAELESFDAHGELSAFSNELKQLLSSSLNSIVDSEGMKFKFPPEVASLNPRFTDAHLTDAEGGKGELHIEASGVIRAADMARIMTLIAR